MTPGIRLVTAAQCPEDWRRLSNPLYGLSDSQQLAELLGVPLGELRRISRSTTNYICFEKKTGGKLRLVTAPRPRLDMVHSQILGRLKMLSVPDYLHSGVAGRSHVTNAATHVGGAWLCKIDLRAFYLQISAARVRRFFSNQMRCSDAVAALLARLCTLNGHLPIGARISQPLAFLAMKPMLDEVHQLANSLDARFTCYVDDLCCSGDRATPAFLWRMKKIIHKHGFQYHQDRCYRPGEPRLVTGVLLMGGAMTLRARDAGRIWHDMAALATREPTEPELSRLQGRLAAAQSIDDRYSRSLRVVRRRLRLHRGARRSASALSSTQAP